jgi:phenylacetate-CoA ligase
MLNFIGPLMLYPLAESRTGRNIRSKEVFIRQRVRMNWAFRENLMIRSLIRSLDYAKNKVPYYRDILADFDPQLLEKDVAYLSKVPILTKETILEQGDRMVSDDWRDSFLHIRKTGGSTGHSLTVRYSQEDLDWTAAVNLAVGHFTERTLFQKEIHISADFDQQPTNIDRIYTLVKNISMNRENVLFRDASNQGLERLANNLAQKKATLVQAHPSTIFALATWVVPGTFNKSRPLFEKFVSTGEAIHKHQVRLIEERLGCKVYNRYGSAEFGVIAHSKNSADNLEVLEMVAYPENIESDPKDAKRLILTAQLNQAMPLIRYDTGDIATVEKNHGGYFLKNLVGRQHDLVTVGNRTVFTHYIQDFLDRLGLHHEFQIVYRNIDRIALKIRIVPKSNEDISQAITQALESEFKATIPVEIVTFEKLNTVGWRNKFSRAVPEDL